MIEAARRVAADDLFAVDQRSLALGPSSTVSANASLKAEPMRTDIGRVSYRFDVPPRQPGSCGLRVRTFSASVNVAF